MDQRLRAALNAVPLTDYSSARMRCLLRSYDKLWGVRGVAPIATEIQFSFEIPNTGGWVADGRIDLIATTGGDIVVVDHKTTSEYLSSAADRHRTSGQGALYVLGARALGHDVTKMMYAIVRRHSLVPRSGEPVLQYEDRYREKCEASMVEKTLSDHELEKYLDDLAGDIRLIESDIPPTRNDGACLSFGTMCGFHSHCFGAADLEGISVHRDTRPKSLSYSRRRSLLECRQKHHLTYVKQRQPVGVFSEQASFGVAFHKAMEVYWSV